jgi:hypothetical protein
MNKILETVQRFMIPAPAFLPKSFLGFLSPDLALRRWKAGQHVEVAFGHARACANDGVQRECA